jgi:hypothetical protein
VNGPQEAAPTQAAQVRRVQRQRHPVRLRRRPAYPDHLHRVQGHRAGLSGIDRGIVRGFCGVLLGVVLGTLLWAAMFAVVALPIYLLVRR